MRNRNSVIVHSPSCRSKPYFRFSDEHKVIAECSCCSFPCNPSVWWPSFLSFNNDKSTIKIVNMILLVFWSKTALWEVLTEIIFESYGRKDDNFMNNKICQFLTQSCHLTSEEYSAWVLKAPFMIITIIIQMTKGCVNDNRIFISGCLCTIRKCSYLHICSCLFLSIP